MIRVTKSLSGAPITIDSISLGTGGMYVVAPNDTMEALPGLPHRRRPPGETFLKPS